MNRVSRSAALALLLTACLAGALATPAAADGDGEQDGALAKVVLDSTPTTLLGSAPPALKVERWVDGQEHSWKTLDDKVVVVVFWEVWSAGSRRLNRRLARLCASYGDRGLVVVSVHPQQNADRAIARVKKKKHPFALAIDAGRATAEAFESTRRVPTLHVVVKGKLVFPHVDTGVDGNVEAAIARGLAGQVGEDAYTIPQRIAPPKVSTVRTARSRPILEAVGGKPAPALVVSRWASEAKPTLASLKGKVVLLDFWGKWCPPCVAALPKLVKLHETFGPKGLVIVGVHSTMQNEGLEQWLKEHQVKLPYPIAVDDASKTIARYRVTAYPTMVLIDRSGKVRRAYVGFASSIDKDIAVLVAEAAPKPAEGQPAKQDAPADEGGIPGKEDD